MAKNFITGAAQRVTDSAQRVTAIMKDRPDITTGKAKRARGGSAAISNRSDATPSVDSPKATS
jgi:hypothetical protein